MIICYSGRSKPSALAIADAGQFELTRTGQGDINWGRARANTSLNPDISNVTNKRLMRELFAEHGVPMPRLYSVEELDRMVQVINGRRERFEAIITVVGRPDRHSKGRGFWKCTTMSDVRKALEGTRRKKPATHFMEYIDAPREYRVHIFKDKSIRISEKTFGEFEDKDYITTKPVHNVKHVRKAAKKALSATELDFGAVDILADDNNCWVLEVNAAPGLGGSMPQLYADVFAKWQRGEW